MSKNLIFSLFLCGSFISVFGQPGSLDLSFGVGGAVRNGSADVYYDIKLQPNGKFVTCGSVLNLINTSYDFYLARYLSNGNPDSTFGVNGFVLHDLGGDEYANSLQFQSDGKIVIGGTLEGADADYVIARYLANGIPDSSFGINGFTLMQRPEEQYAYSVLIQTNGSIVIGGEEYISATSIYDICLARVDSTGAIDFSFGSSGFVIQSRSAADDDCYAMTQQTDGKIITAGESDNGGYYDVFMSRMNANGVLDSTFGTNGFVSTDLGAYSVANGVTVQPDGKIVLGGAHSNSNGDDEATLFRYNANGNLDSTFGTNGVISFPSAAGTSAYAGMIAIQSNSKIVSAGYSESNSADIVVYRVNGNGSPDITFGNAGAAVIDLGTAEYGIPVALQPDGKILVCGMLSGSSDSALIIRLTGGEAVAITQQESQYTKQIVVYPNPSAGQANLLLELSVASEVEILISDISGKVLVQQNHGMMNEGMHTLDLTGNTNLASGSYMVQVKTGNEMQVFKLIISN